MCEEDFMFDKNLKWFHFYQVPKVSDFSPIFNIMLSYVKNPYFILGISNVGKHLKNSVND
jgi:hypothetical protein